MQRLTKNPFTWPCLEPSTWLMMNCEWCYIMSALEKKWKAREFSLLSFSYRAQLRSTDNGPAGEEDVPVGALREPRAHLSHCSHHSGLGCPFAGLSPLLYPTRTYLSIYFTHGWTDAESKGEMVIVLKEEVPVKQRQESTFSPLRALQRPPPTLLQPATGLHGVPWLASRALTLQGGGMNVIKTSLVSASSGKLTVLKEWNPQEHRLKARVFLRLACTVWLA